jgi:hypothetical protein
MQKNDDYDLAAPIQTAIKAKSPYVGVPMPGHAPLIFKRSLLAGALKGVKPVYIQVDTLDNGVRVLTVEGTAGAHVRTRCRIVSIARRCLTRGAWGEERKAMDKWKPSMVSKAIPAAPKSTKHDKAILVLEKRLIKLGNRPSLANPATATGYARQDHAEWLKWYQQKSLRGKVGALGKMTRTGVLDSREFYKAMDALPEIGKVTRFSELDTRQKESIQRDVRDRFGRNGFFDYSNPKVLWNFMPSLKYGYGGRPRISS